MTGVQTCALPISCRFVAPVIEEIADDYAGKVKVCKLNTDENASIEIGRASCRERV